ncbi:MAG: 16S rRNA (guanine(527)-N(7))-methyltransferase RsmG [Pseudomonadota bacterium]
MSTEADAFAERFAVSRETSARLEAYVEELRRWNKAINLVAPATLAEVWTRHIADSAQLLALAPENPRLWLDLGAGGGLPGLVIAALAPTTEIVLVESDTRKAAFLRAAATRMGLTPRIEAKRIEALAPFAADVVSARALAPLPKLLTLAAPFLGQTTTALFHKGARVDQELTALDPAWHSRIEQFPSMTDPKGRILRIRDARAHGA